mmetsp:Transcript_49238/g.115168  ORF Transcript_49238/g.115168 Transcript_49238/m.115168 type:complete len:207 (-) Transcript_49238:275-895(-)
MSTCALKWSGVISTIGRNSIRTGSTPDTACADVAKNSYWRYFKVCKVESRMSPLYSSKMYSHSKTCLSTSWKAILAASSTACEVKYFLSVFDTFFLPKSSTCFLAVFSSRSFRLRLSKFAFKLLLLMRCKRTGFMMLKSISLLTLEIALCGASGREIWLIASLNLQLSEMINGSSVWANPEVTDSLKPISRSLKLSTPFMKSSTFS